MGTMTSFGTSKLYAVSLEVIGNDLGLEVLPSGSKLFDFTNLNPGDTAEEKIDIKNNHTLPFEVFMRTERTSPKPAAGEADLFKQLILTIYLDDIEIYSGPMKDYVPSNISLGNFNPNTEKELRAIVHLPGLETGNEFQGKSLEVKWYFIATMEEPEEPEEPQEPENPEEPEEPQVPEAPEEPKDPTEPTDPTKPQIPSEPDEPSEEIKEIDEVIPETRPETPVEVDEVAEIEEGTPKAAPSLPRTGDIPSIIYYSLGIILLGGGVVTRRKINK